MNTHTLVGGQRLVNVHSPSVCAGEHCCIHNPSAHHMAEWPQNFREDRGMMERLCAHGIGHPDPDDPTTDTTHGCDGCCTPPAEVDPHTDWGMTDLKTIQDAVNADIARLASISGYRHHINPDGSYSVTLLADGKGGWVDPEEPVGYDGFGAPLYAHQIDPQGTE